MSNWRLKWNIFNCEAFIFDILVSSLAKIFIVFLVFLLELLEPITIWHLYKQYFGYRSIIPKDKAIPLLKNWLVKPCKFFFSRNGLDKCCRQWRHWLQKLEHIFLNPHQFVGRKYWKLVNLKSAECFYLLTITRESAKC